jgi:hypothetical protein
MTRGTTRSAGPSGVPIGTDDPEGDESYLRQARTRSWPDVSVGRTTRRGGHDGSRATEYGA